MNARTPRSRFALAALLASLVIATFWGRGEGDFEDRVQRADAVPSVRAGHAKPPSRERGASVEIERLQSRDAPTESASDPFAMRGWRSAEPPAPPRIEQQAPAAPPLPFTYMGRILSEERNAVFVLQGERSLIVREGDTIDSIYRVDRIGNAQLSLIHLPTGARQALAIGALR